MEEAVAALEVDGWRRRSGDLGNHHRMARKPDGTWTNSVVFFRHVRPDGAPVL